MVVPIKYQSIYPYSTLNLTNLKRIKQTSNEPHENFIGSRCTGLNSAWNSGKDALHTQLFSESGGIRFKPTIYRKNHNCSTAILLQLRLKQTEQKRILQRIKAKKARQSRVN